MLRCLAPLTVLALALPVSFISLASFSPANAQAPANTQAEPLVTTADFDLNRDGRPDSISVDSIGTISVSIAGSTKTGAWTALSTSGTVVGATLQVSQHTSLGGRTIIVASARVRGPGAVKREAVILNWTPGRLEALWRGAVGTVGRDGEASISIELGRFGVIKYSNRAGVFRCDGETAHLAAERFDFKSSRFRPARQAIRVPTETPTLVAQAQAPQGVSPDARGIWFRARGASSSLRATSVAELVAPVEIADGDDETAWVENKGGTGRGEFVTLSSEIGEVPVKAVRLYLGHGGANEDFNRPKRMALLLGKDQKYWIDVPSDPRGRAQWIVLPKAIPARCVSLILDDVYPRTASRANTGRTAISEVSILSDTELKPGGSANFLAKRVADGAVGADLGRMLATVGETAGPALVAQLRSDKRPIAQLRIRLALARVPHAPEQLVLGLVSTDLKAEDYATFTKGLRQLGDTAAQALLAELERKPDVKATERVAKMLAHLGSPAAFDGLTRKLGQGSALGRRAMIRALAQNPNWTKRLLELVEATEDAPTKADLYSALGASGAHHPAGSATRHTVESLLAGAMERSTGYEQSYRLVQALGEVAGPLAVVALQRKFEASLDGTASAIAMRRIIARALGKTKAPSALVTLGGSLLDSDPGLRLTAISELREIKESPAAPLAKRLAEDEWPEVRRAAAAALAGRCAQVDTLVALRQAARTDDDVQVARTAFSAVISCPKADGFALALHLVDDSKRPLGLRLHAGRSLGRLDNGSRSQLIFQRYSRLRRQALSKNSSAELAAAMTSSLVDIASPKAISLLESTARDPAFPELQAAAVTGLGALCPLSARKLLQRLKREGQQGVNVAARQALQRCVRR